MNSKEFRLGNYVNFGSTLSEITGIMAEEIMFRYESGGENRYALLQTPGINVIPVTEEWLLNLGFERSKGAIQNDNDKIYRLRDSDDEAFYISFGEDPMLCVDGFGGLQYFDYVHELQNLYSTLGIKELTLK